MLDIIFCANFGVKELKGLGNTRDQILKFSIEMAGHLYNRAGATAQPVIVVFFRRFLLKIVTSRSIAVIVLFCFILKRYRRCFR